MMLTAEGQYGKTVHVVFESRETKEDAELELEFRRIAGNNSHWGYRRHDFSRFDFQPAFITKAANASGLQLADLTARPITLSQLRPGQPNRVFEIIRPRLGGLKCFPYALVSSGKTKRPPEAPGPLCRPGNAQSFDDAYIATEPLNRKLIRAREFCP